MTSLDKVLSGGDLRSIGKSNSVVLKVRSQNDFDKLFKCLFHNDRVVVMRTADAIEKITLWHPSYLIKHKKALLELCHSAKNKELKWHLALLISRLNLSGEEIQLVWQILTGWASDKEKSRIVRVNAIQALYEIARKEKRFIKDFQKILAGIEQENIPSINARVRKLNKAIIR